MLETENKVMERLASSSASQMHVISMAGELHAIEPGLSVDMTL